MTARGRRQKEDHPSVASGNTSTPEDATPFFSENEPAHSSLKNLNNGSTTTNPQTKHTHKTQRKSRKLLSNQVAHWESSGLVRFASLRRPVNTMVFVDCKLKYTVDILARSLVKPVMVITHGLSKVGNWCIRNSGKIR